MEINDFARMNHERSASRDEKGVFNWEYHAIAMAGEAGELLNILKKVKRGDFLLDKKKVADEAVDVITYGFLLLSSLGIDAEKAIMEKYEEVNRRLEAGGFDKRV